MSTDIHPTPSPDQLSLGEQLMASYDRAAEHLDGPSPRGAAVSPASGDEIVVLSAAGRSAPVAWRERLAVHTDREGAAAAELTGAGTIVEAMVLSTCGRFDIYAVTSDADRAERELVRWVARRCGCAVETVAGRVLLLRGRAAARHAIATAAGLRSPVLGEHEILGQLRRARDRAAHSGAAGPTLDRLVVEALRAGGRVRATTALGRGSVSVLSVGVQLVVALCPGAGRRAHVLGRSRTAAAARDRLLAGGWAVTSAADLSAPSPLRPFLRAFDAVVTCTGTPASSARRVPVRPTAFARPAGCAPTSETARTYSSRRSRKISRWGDDREHAVRDDGTMAMKASPGSPPPPGRAHHPVPRTGTREAPGYPARGLSTG